MSLIRGTTVAPWISVSSKLSASKTSQRAVYPDSFGEGSIYIGTPDSSSLSEDVYLSSMAAFSGVTSRTPAPDVGSRRDFHDYCSSSDEEEVPVQVKGQQSWSRTITPDDQRGDISSSSIFAWTGNRLGSINNATPAPRTPEESLSSSNPIGYLPIQSPTYHTKSLDRQRSSKPLPAPNVLSGPSIAEAPLLLSSSDASKMLKLMKATWGRMHGILSFRTATTTAWKSGFFVINSRTGSLIYNTKGGSVLTNTLIPDLRGCQIRSGVDPESGMDYLSVLTFTSGLCVELRPPRRDNFDSWLAAFLCWQPIRPKGVQNKMTKPQSVALEDRQIANRRRNSKSTVQREAAILKVGKMLLWDRPNAFSTSGQQQTLSPAWQQVSCTLQENGAFRLFKESANTLVTCIPLSQLSRCAIQHLNSSVLEHEFCIAIYPQYATHMALGPTRPVYLALESRVCFEAWFVLLRAFTIPEFYGPEMPLEDDPSQKPGPTEPPTGNIADMFRVERMLAVRVIEAELFPRKASEESTQSRKHPKSISDISTSAGSNYYTEILLDGELRAKTAVKYNTANPSWREDLVFDNLPPVLSQISVLVKTRNPIQTDWNRVAHGTDASNQDSTLIHVLDDVELSFRDAAYGRVDISLDDLKSGIETEEWWPVLDDQNLSIGKMLINARMEDTVVLMSGEYAPMSELLHTFTNKLITNMVQIMPSKLSQLAEALLDIYQVSGTTVEWLSALIEDEIGELRVSTANRLRDTMIYANSSCGLIREQEVFFHNIEHTAIVEVNFLLQDNSLLTEALKYHMRRLGKEYLEETIGELLHEIDENNTECEVEPSRILHGSGDLERNWRKLISLTTSVWKAILTSVSQCPAELRFIFRYIRACAEACYGDILSTVTYSSVSGFLFLRFFCPAILNPKLFGLLRDRPRPRAQRTLTLILHG